MNGACGFPQLTEAERQPPPTPGSFEDRVLGWDHSSICTAETYAKAKRRQVPGQPGSPSVELKRARRAGTGQAGGIIEPRGRLQL